MATAEIKIRSKASLNITHLVDHPEGAEGSVLEEKRWRARSKGGRVGEYRRRQNGKSERLYEHGGQSDVAPQQGLR